MVKIIHVNSVMVCKALVVEESVTIEYVFKYVEVVVCTYHNHSRP